MRWRHDCLDACAGFFVCKLKKVANGQKEDAHDDGAASGEGEPEQAEDELAAPAAAAAADTAEAVPAARGGIAAPGKKGKLGKRPAPDSTGTAVVELHEASHNNRVGCAATLRGSYLMSPCALMGVCARVQGRGPRMAPQQQSPRRRSGGSPGCSGRPSASWRRRRLHACKAVLRAPQRSQRSRMGLQQGRSSTARGKAKGPENGVGSQPAQQDGTAKKGSKGKGEDKVKRSEQQAAAGQDRQSVSEPATTAAADNGGGAQAVDGGKRKAMKKLLGTAGAAVSAGGGRQKLLHGTKAAKRKGQGKGPGWVQ